MTSSAKARAAPPSTSATSAYLFTNFAVRGVQAGHVLPDEHLRVTRWPGADPDGRDGSRRGDLGRQVGGHSLQNDGKGAGGFQCLGVVQQAVAVLAPALDAVPAEHVDRLRSQPEVSHHWNPGGHKLLDLPDHALAALKLDRVAPASLRKRVAAARAAAGDIW